jgi:hypothetical protein
MEIAHGFFLLLLLLFVGFLLQTCEDPRGKRSKSSFPNTGLATRKDISHLLITSMHNYSRTHKLEQKKKKKKKNRINFKVQHNFTFIEFESEEASAQAHAGVIFA